MTAQRPASAPGDRSAPYWDSTLSIDARLDDLLSRLSLEEKVGLMFQRVTPVPPSGVMEDDVPRPGQRGIHDVLDGAYITHLNVHVIPSPERMASWVNQIQRYARENTPHGIPVTVSTDPRHSFTENSGASFTADHFSAWPEPLGLAAIGDEDLVRTFARSAREEYLAVGLRAALHPTIDLATEPRWARQYGTFGQDADLAARLAIAYLDGFEGPTLGTDSVSCMVKHFPGGGPQLDGEDPHFPYGREQVYPGGAFEYHLAPFRRVIARGVSAIMPYYGMPVGLERNGEAIASVGFGFNRQIITGILREELGYDGVVCSDWGLLTESRTVDHSLPARAWGVEHLSVPERMAAVIDAGCDQFGGEENPEIVVELVRSGVVAESRIDESARRLLRVKFELGLFDDPFVDEKTADDKVGRPEYRAMGHRAQAESVTILTNGDDSPTLPLPAGTRVFADEIDDETLRGVGLVPCASSAAADVVIARIDAPFDPRDTYMLEASFHAGSLEFDEVITTRLASLAAQAPLVVAIHLDRPAVLTPVAEVASAVVGVYGSSDAALMDALTDRITPRGRLPFDLPRHMSDVENTRPDLPGDLGDPLFGVGHGLVYPNADGR